MTPGARRLSALFALLAAAGLSACGFQPLYGNTGSGLRPGDALAMVYVEPISERVGYQLRNDLLDLFGASGQPQGTAYRLKVIITRELTEPVSLERNATITRFNYRLTAHYELTPTSATAPAKIGDATALSAYNVASSPYATVIAQRDASDRAARDIAERVRTELAVFFHESGNALGATVQPAAAVQPAAP
jgi:LPS-assembly lipoprotein